MSARPREGEVLAAGERAGQLEALGADHELARGVLADAPAEGPGEHLRGAGGEAEGGRAGSAEGWGGVGGGWERAAGGAAGRAWLPKHPPRTRTLFAATTACARGGEGGVGHCGRGPPCAAVDRGSP